jgi:hypothetical protein
MRLAVHSVAVHEKNGKTWAQLPSQPWIKDGAHVKGEDGKPQYSPLFEFDSAAVRQAFSATAVRAVLTAFPDALECEDAA